MKTMNYVLAFVLIFTLGSCSKESAVQDVESEELAAIDFKGKWFLEQEKEEAQEIFAIDLQQYYLWVQRASLEKQKSELEEQIEGGDENKIPIWETIVEQININTEKLASIFENSCSYLEFREQQLENALENGDESAERKLVELRSKLWDVCNYNVFETQTVTLMIVGGKIGGNCAPGVDFVTCIPKLGAGTLLINSIDELGGYEEVYFKSSEGEILSEGEVIGHHHEIDGVSQIAIELEPIQNGILEIKSERGSFSKVINVY